MGIVIKIVGGLLSVGDIPPCDFCSIKNGHVQFYDSKIKQLQKRIVIGIISKKDSKWEMIFID
jgi:hypothetical protein